MFKRVISNPEELGSQSKKLEFSSKELDGTTATEARMSSTGTPAVVIPAEKTTAKEQEAPLSSSMPSERVMIQAENESVLRRAEALLLTRTDSKNSVSSSANSSVRTGQSGSKNGSGNWGWFEDVHASGPMETSSNKKKDKWSGKGQQGLVPVRPFVGDAAELTDIVSKQQQQPQDDAAAAVTAPNYVLEESLSSQKLWKDTAGTRPPQPVEERAFYEKMWAQNFARSHVDYQIPHEVLAASSPIFLSPFADHQFDDDTNHHAAGGRGDHHHPPSNLQHYNVETQATDEEIAHAIHRLHDAPSVSSAGNNVNSTLAVNKTVKGSASDGDLTVMIRGDNVFGTTVSKSFLRQSEIGNMEGVDTVNISIASYRVVESKTRGKYAQFLVIYREGSIRDTMGVWKRYSDFHSLSRKVTQAHEGCSSVLANMSPMHITQESDVEHLPNAITSWRLLKKRQRWYRCLDAGYLSLKVFLLERFLHDILFESSSPGLLREFVTAGHGGNSSCGSSSSGSSDGSQSP